MRFAECLGDQSSLIDPLTPLRQGVFVVQKRGVGCGIDADPGTESETGFSGQAFGSILLVSLEFSVPLFWEA